MNKTELEKWKREAERKLEEAKVLIQPEKSWVSDQQRLVALCAEVERLRESNRLLRQAFDLQKEANDD